jgi:hypothetical protein
MKITEWKNGSVYGYIRPDLSISIGTTLPTNPTFSGISASATSPGIYAYNVAPGDTLDVALVFADSTADSTALYVYGEPVNIAHVLADTFIVQQLSLTSDSVRLVWAIDSSLSRNYPYTIIFSGVSYSHSGLTQQKLQHDIIALVNVSGPYTNDCWPLLPYTGIDELKGYNELISYPNPADQTVYIPIPKDANIRNLQLNLYTVTGQEQNVKYSLQEGKLAIDRGKLPAGMYFFSLNSGDDGLTGKGKIVFQ